MSQPSSLRTAGAELVGTAVVVLGGPGVVVLGGAEVGALEVAIGSGLAAAVAIGALGAVANPMFSLTLWFARAISLKELVTDWAGVAGGIAGAAILWGLTNTRGLTTGVNGWEPDDGVGAGVDLGVTVGPFAELGVVIAAELVGCVVLVVVLLASVRERVSNTTTALYVGTAAALSTLLLFGVSGAGLNPARSIGTALFADTEPAALGQLWVFVVVPLVAAFAGLLIWLAIDEATIDDTVFDESVLERVADAAGDLAE